MALALKMSAVPQHFPGLLQTTLLSFFETLVLSNDGLSGMA
jgi:hypothetical protein